jgi:hypothetical protein
MRTRLLGHAPFARHARATLAPCTCPQAMPLSLQARTFSAPLGLTSAERMVLPMSVCARQEGAAPAQTDDTSTRTCTPSDTQCESVTHTHTHTHSLTHSFTPTHTDTHARAHAHITQQSPDTSPSSTVSRSLRSLHALLSARRLSCAVLGRARDVTAPLSKDGLGRGAREVCGDGPRSASATAPPNAVQQLDGATSHKDTPGSWEHRCASCGTVVATGSWARR